MKHFLGLSLLFGLAPLLLADPAAGQERPRRTYRIGVLFWHDSANDERAWQGIREGLQAAGIALSLDLVRVEQDEKKAAIALDRWRTGRFDLVFAMGTQATLLATQALRRVPIVFAAVTNPRSAGLPGPGECRPEGNITGVSNWVYPRFLLREFHCTLPSLRRLGVLYDPENLVSTEELRRAQAFLAGSGRRRQGKEPAPWVKKLRRNLQLVARPVRNVIDIEREATRLARTCDALWIPIDYRVYQNLSLTAAITDPLGKPLFTSSLKGIDRAVLGVTVDFRLLGLKAAAAALKILEGRKPVGRIPVATMESHRVVINLNAAKRIGFEVPLTVLCNAEEVINAKRKE